MKKTILITLLLSVVLSASSQIAVESFRRLDTDLTAITHGTQEIDQNGEVAALIKVVTTQQGFTFDGGTLGIVKVVQQPGEIWVYVPRKLQKISIAHPNLGILRDYYFQIPIEGGRTYELVISTGEVITTVQKARTSQYLTIRVTPPNATLYVDDEQQPLSAEGTFFKLVSLGRHTYRLQAAGYKSAAGVVEVKASEKADVPVELQSLEGILSIECVDKEADIVVNAKVKGRGSWKGYAFPGTYKVEARRNNYRTITEEVTLGEMEKKSVTLASPTPILGTLRVESDPMGAMVFVDNKRYEKTPCVLDESVGLFVGSHEVTLTKEGYANYTIKVVLKENEETVLSDIRLQPGQTDAGHEYVDLGLSVKWATCNVGASSPEDYGDYFAWGETRTKKDFSWETLEYHTSGDSDENVKFSKYVMDSDYGTIDNKAVLDLSDDVARKKWGGSWHMPTKEEFDELINKCTWTWTTQGGQNGYKVTSKSNGKSIFLPAAGFHIGFGASLGIVGAFGYYWSSSIDASSSNKAWVLGFGEGGHSTSRIGRKSGQSVRPVCP